MNDTPRPPYPGLDPDLLRLANMIDRLRQRAEAAEARLKHEQVNTEAGARLCNEAFAVLTTKVGTLEAKLAKSEKAHATALSALEAERKSCEELRKQVEVLSNLRNVLSRQRDEAITTREAALRQRDARIKQAEALEAELSEAKAAAQADHEQWVVALRELRTELTRQRNEALCQRDAALADLAGVVRQRDVLTRQRTDALKACTDLARDLAQQSTPSAPSAPSVRVTVCLTEEDDGLPD